MEPSQLDLFLWVHLSVERLRSRVLTSLLDLEKGMMDCLYAKCTTPCITDCVMAELEKLGKKYRLDLEKGMMDCLYAKCTTPCITDCVMAELEKLGQKYRVALRIAKDPRFDRLPCIHKGTYADDCIVDRVTQDFLLAC
ncbi:rRNA-processing protein FCF1 homolog isoform X2 [Asparagus officinalis]|uniref:rRNA-processing protein FCF1 homolog isoform X2 n=1 Tax=Asparagus officinalis TaxID=4686 RepID=UPI00098E3F8B|nr:rRNA-processing protein FCF1 homolog isoform X2 [Asparagus officinalis]